MSRIASLNGLPCCAPSVSDASAAIHLAEIETMQRLAAQKVQLAPARRAAQAAYLQTLKAEWLTWDTDADADESGKCRDIASVSTV